MSSSLRVVYAGTPEFSVPALQALCDSEHDVVAVYTQPDRRAGRGRKLAESPVKVAARAQGLPVEQPPSFKEAATLATLQTYRADVMVVAAYGLILPVDVLSAPVHGCLNIHASLLPRWRGAAPIQRAIEAGDSKTGITIMQMDKGLDTGDMLHKAECDIHPETIAASLHDTLARLGADALMKTLATLQQGKLTPVAQDDSLATYARKLEKSEALINWNDSAESIHRRVCAFNPWPVAQTMVEGETLRIWESVLPVEAQAILDTESFVPGTVVRTDSAVDVMTGDGVLRLLKVQPPGKKPMLISDYLNSRQPQIGSRLG